MFEYNGEQYELRFTLSRIELVENVIKGPVVASIVATNGALSISMLKTCFGFCAKKVGADEFVSRKEGAKMCEDLIETEGYIKINNMVIEKMAKDIPFLFQGA